MSDKSENELREFKAIFCYIIQDTVYRNREDCRLICSMYHYCIVRQWDSAAVAFSAGTRVDLNQSFDGAPGGR
jgi:hypothetical protein